MPVFTLLFIVLAVVLAYELIRKNYASFFIKSCQLAKNALFLMLQKIIKRIMRSIRHIYEALDAADNDKTKIIALSPVDIADEKRVYEKNLLEALSQSDVLNIAVAGPYGSGKSSIIKTFQKRHPEFNYLKVSLAAFKDDEDDQPPGQQKVSGNQEKSASGSNSMANLNEQVEYSILQQIFYHVTKKQIPFSRFKRIRSMSSGWIWVLSFGLFVYALCLFYLFFYSSTSNVPDAWKYWLDNHIDILARIANIVVISGTLFIIFGLLKLYQNSKLVKLNLHSAELEISPDKDSSILNKHLDEILYFFSATRFDVLVIEDLDRFTNTDIFVKLRELNTLVNSSGQVKRKVVFIYAVRDDLFKDESRTKFFDVIIPVIPITNAANSAGILNRMFAEMALPRPIPEEFLNDLGLFIQDMRLLINITNEFRVYKEQLGSFEVNYTHLLAIIVFKNIYPTLFSELQYNKGKVYDFFSERENYIERITEELTGKKQELHEEIKTIKQNHFKSTNELRMVYLAALIRKFYKDHSNFAGRIILNNFGSTDFEDLLKDGQFASLRANSNIQFYYYGGGTSNSKITFEKIEKSVDSDETYEQRERKLANYLGHEVSLLEIQLAEVEREIAKIRGYSMMEIYNEIAKLKIDTPIDIFPLLRYLIRYGYLNEEYRYYLSYFVEGEISQKDLDFIWSIKQRNPLPWNHTVQKLPALLKRLRVTEFSLPEILNFKMMDHLLAVEDADSERIQLILSQLKKLDANSARFIDEYLSVGKYGHKLIKLFCHSAPVFWKFVLLDSNYLPDKINGYLKLIINHADIEDIERLNDNGIFIAYMAIQAWLATPLTQGVDEDKLKNICEKFKLEFDFPPGNMDIEQGMLNYIYEDDRYVLNKRMVSLILQEKIPEYNELKFERGHYTEILASNLGALKGRIENNFETYVANVFPFSKVHDRESQEAMLKILNSEDIPDELAEKVIESTQFKLPNINDCADVELWETLLINDRVVPSWENVLVCYEETTHIEGKKSGLTNGLVQFLNRTENSELLGKSIIHSPGESLKMVQEIFSSGRLNHDAYLLLMPSIGAPLDDVDFDKIHSDIAEALISANKIKFDVNSVKNLKRIHHLHAISWMISNWDEFLAKTDEFSLEVNDYSALLQDNRLSVDMHNQLLAKIDNSKLVDVISVGVHIPDNIIEERNIGANYNILEGLSINPAANKSSIVSLLITNLGGLTSTEQEKVLSNLGGDFESIVRRSDPKVQKTLTMERLLRRLKDNGRLVENFEIKGKSIQVQSIRA